MKLYKITDEKNCSKNATQWGVGITHELPPCNDPKLCTNKVIHAYRTAEQVAFMYLAHVSYSEPHLWKAEGDIVVDDGTKVGVFRLTTLIEIPMPVITTEQRIEIAIRCAKLVCTDERWNNWADKWLDGTDRSNNAAHAAAYVAAHAAAYATYDAAYAAAKAITIKLIEIIDGVLKKGTQDEQP